MATRPPRDVRLRIIFSSVRGVKRLFAGVVLAVVVTGCGTDDGDSGEVTVVATTPHVADLVRNVAGDRADVETLVEPEADPHDFEPRPSDARDLAEADVVFRSGGDVDDWLGSLLDSAGGDADEVTLIDSVETVESAGDTDPHWWQDPRNAERAVAAIRDALADADPDGRDTYDANARAYSERLRALDRGIAACIGRVPADRRKLVTTHDSFGYYARRYGLAVIGALIPSLSSQAQASAGEVDRLVDQIERERVEAIFPESALDPRLEEAVARESGAEVADELWADTLGPDGSGAETYLDAMALNTERIVDGLSGGREECRPRA
jgi:zinc/manganese transport system substrate-binding protein